MATVLVVEDSHSQRECISYQLRWHGWTVIQASDGLEALEKIKATSPDVVLLDLVMPRIDGYQVCRLIKANPETRNIPIVFLTGKARPLTLYASIIQHAEAYVSKPWQPQELLNTVKQVLANARKLHAIASTESWIEYGLLNLKMIKAYQSKADAWTKYGLQLTMFYQRAIASFQQALNLDPNRLEASQYLTSVQQNWAMVLEKLERTKPCTVCYYYYGQDEITCAVHPMGRLAEVCRDWDLI